MRDEIESTLVPSACSGYVSGPGGLIADFVAAFAGIDGILLGVALLRVLVILLIVYRSPILPLRGAAHRRVRARARPRWSIYPLAKNDVDHAERPEPGHPVHPRGRRRRPTTRCCWSPGSGRSCTTTPSTWVALQRAWRGVGRADRAPARRPSSSACSACCSSELRSTRGLGPVGAIGIAGALLAALTFLPAVLLLLRPVGVLAAASRSVDHVHAEDAVGTSGLWGRVAGLVGRHPRRIWVITLVVLAACWRRSCPTFKAERRHPDRQMFLDPGRLDHGQEVLGRALPGRVRQPGRDHRRRRPTPTRRRQVVRATPGVADGRRRPAGRRRHRPPARRRRWSTATCWSRPPSSGRRQRGGRGHRAAGCGPTSTRSAPTCWSAATPRSTSTSSDATERDLRVIIPAILLVILIVLMLLLRSLVAPLLLVARQRAVVRGDHRASRPGVQPRLRLPRRRPVDAAVRRSCSWSRSASTTRSS